MKEREWLKEARIKKGLTQSQLADMIGISRNAIIQYEKGKRFPIPRVLMGLCKILNIDIELFYKENY